ncbi:hypothetical protein H2199_004896 [Coniosporium tulheliwenetii]|uniref:Uncharacterized protein n=1 Tax=Coniosporium tulheliwenetii TaxID=3383036 RepID=A0ACC2Z4H2_9PEZI|nr:hypothetical protein H2199_004896 [Cladosporium sp. JES 115]
MGFATGFIGGLTLTTSVLYLSVYIHRQNRLNQSLYLRQSHLILTSLIEPPPPSTPPRAREARPSLVETVKDRWNGEIEGLVRRALSVDWNGVREGMERAVARGWGKLRREVEEIDKARPDVEPSDELDVGLERGGVQDGVRRVEDAVARGWDRVVDGVRESSAVRGRSADDNVGSGRSKEGGGHREERLGRLTNGAKEATELREYEEPRDELDVGLERGGDPGGVREMEDAVKRGWEKVKNNVKHATESGGVPEPRDEFDVGLERGGVQEDPMGQMGEMGDAVKRGWETVKTNVKKAAESEGSSEPRDEFDVGLERGGVQNGGRGRADSAVTRGWERVKSNVKKAAESGGAPEPSDERDVGLERGGVQEGPSGQMGDALARGWQKVKSNVEKASEGDARGPSDELDIGLERSGVQEGAAGITKGPMARMWEMVVGGVKDASESGGKPEPSDELEVGLERGGVVDERR